MSARLLITGWSLYLPGVDTGTAIASVTGAASGAWSRVESPPPERAAAVLGRKGLLAKEPATRLALCAVHRALGLAPGERPDRTPSPRTAVVACGNLGNVATVADVARTVEADGGRAVSVLDAPNASSNVVASTVALWFGFGGPNLMVCSGDAAGADALRLASLLLRARRADEVVLVGAEPADDVATALHATAGSPWALRAGAACLVLRRWPDAPERAVGRAAVELAPAGAPWPRTPRVVVGAGGFDPATHWGDCYGAHGVVALALAAHLAADEDARTVGVALGDGPGAPTALVDAAVSARG